MLRFSKKSSISDLQKINTEIYGISDDRFFSMLDLLSNQIRFTMRALKGIRQNNLKKIRLNTVIAFSWLLAITGRFHIDIETVLWRRFPFVCSYCNLCPCKCKKQKLTQRKMVKHHNSAKPKSLNDFQQMFAKIYPTSSRTIEAAAIHLAEEVGELSEAINIYFAEHRQKQFLYIENEVADYISCLFGMANSVNINLAHDLSRMYRKGCHVCHKTPCICSFSFVSKFKS